MLIPILLTLLSGQSQARGAELRTVVVSITTAKGEPVPGLTPQELVVLENGVAREVTRVELDVRPLDVAVLVDSSAAVGSSYRLNLVEPVLQLLARLPSGSRYTLWTTGDRPTRLVESTGDVAAAAKALRRVAPQGGSTMIDAIVEAAEELKKKEGGRRVLIAVSGMGVEFSNRDRYQAVERAQAALDQFSAVLFEERGAGDPDADPRADSERRLNYEHVFSRLADVTGGMLERRLSALAVGGALQGIAQDLRSQYRVRYATLPEVKGRKIEVRVSRPDVTVRVGRAGADLEP